MAARTRKPTTPEWEWLSLIDAEGPFLSKAALKSFHPSGLPSELTADQRELFKDEFTRWSAAWSSSADEYTAARDRWIEVVVSDLLGPIWGEEEELDVSKVREHYLVGMLAPVRRSTEPDLMDDELPLEDNDQSEEGKTDLGVPLAHTLYPSSVGATFCVTALPL